MTERKIANVGDLVKCINDCGKEFHNGGLYRVTDVYIEYGKFRYSFAFDDLGSITNGWVAEYFVLDEPEPIDQAEYEAVLADQDAYETLRED